MNPLVWCEVRCAWCKVLGCRVLGANVLWCVAITLCFDAASVSAAERYTSISVDHGIVTIATEDGRTVRPSRAPKESAGEPARISRDYRAVAWLAMFEECENCPQYLLPLELVTIRDGRTRRFRAETHEPIWSWIFIGDGKKIAFKSETSHGRIDLNYELWDISANRRIAMYTPTYDESNHTIARPNEPAWVRDLERAAASSKF